jgi:hypothetical protein
MRSIFASAGLALTLVGFAVQQANATPITYEFSGTGSGAIGGSSFTDALVVYTGTADTANIVSNEVSPGIFFYGVPLDGLTVNIAGIGPATVTDPTMVVGVPQAVPDDVDIDDELPPFPLVLVGRIDNPPALDSFTGMAATASNALEGYVLDASIGPIGGVGGVGFNEDCAPGPDPCIGTSLGLLSFTHNIVAEGGGTFTATLQPAPVPEPATLLLVGGGLAAAFIRRSRRG